MLLGLSGVISVTSCAIVAGTSVAIAVSSAIGLFFSPVTNEQGANNIGSDIDTPLFI